MKKTEMQKAEDYLKKAKEILNNTTVADEHYTDVKSVKKAGRTAWKGCITALDYVLSKERHECDDYVHEYNKPVYKDWLKVADDKIVSVFESAFNLSNFSMSCDGETDKVICDRAMYYVEKLFNWCKAKAIIIEQQKEEERRKNAEYWKEHKNDKKLYHQVVLRQRKELEELVVSKSGVSKKEIIRIAYEDFVSANLDLVTPEERKRFDHLVF